MTSKGLFIEYQYCNGCHSCNIACKQEHNYPAGKSGIIISEITIDMSDIDTPNKIRIDYIPFPTEFCDLCESRTKKGEQPACVKHCQAACMQFGTISDLAKAAEDKPRSVIFIR